MEDIMAQYKVAIDAGHGGSDPGAVYNGRQEKDGVLRLAMAVGKILENSGVDVFYVRSEERRVGKECRSRWSPYH